MKPNIAQIIKFISEYYHKKEVLNNEEDWLSLKKYRNFKGETCWDVLNEAARKKAIVISPNNDGEFYVIENEDFNHFVKMAGSMPVFYYVPTISNDGLVFIFESTQHFNRHKSLSNNPKQHYELLKKKLSSVFGEKNLLQWEGKLQFAFANVELQDVIRKLEKNQMKFNSYLADFLDQNQFQVIIPDPALLNYSFPDDQKLSSDDAINVIFETLSSNKDISDKDLARIKILLKKVKVSEFETVKKIALGFRGKKEHRIKALFDAEENRKKAQEVVNAIWKNKKK